MTFHIFGCVICCARHCHQLNPLDTTHSTYITSLQLFVTHTHRAGANTHVNLAGWAHTPAWKKPLWANPVGKSTQ